MTSRQLRWLFTALASGLVTFVLVRRRQQLAAGLPQPLLEQAEHIVIPWPGLERRGARAEISMDEAPTEEADDDGVTMDDTAGDSDSLRRKVSRGSRISFRGKRYGPLPESFVGQYVDVETRADQLFVLHDGIPIATFTLQS